MATTFCAGPCGRSRCSRLLASLVGQPDRLRRQAHLYERNPNLTGPIPKWGPSVTECDGTYQYCSGLGGAIPPWPKNAVTCDQCYMNTGVTGTIPAWPETMTRARMCYQDCKGLTGAWTDDPELLMPDRMNGQEGLVTDHDDVVKDASDALRALFYEDWGGTRAKPEQ